MDRWILSKLNTLVKLVDEHLAVYEITESSRAIAEFSDILSNWYVRRGRDRYWGPEMTEDKKAAYTTLYTVLVTLAKVIAPYTPFMAEMIYQNLVVPFFQNDPISVHLCSFPASDASRIDPALERGMDGVLDIVVAGRAARNAGAVKNRQPLSELYVVTERELDLSDELKNIVCEELNVKAFREGNDAAEFVHYVLKPQLKTLGKKYGKTVNAIRNYLAECDTKAVVDAVAEGGVFETELDGQKVFLSEEDLLISTESKAGFVSAENAGITVALNTALTEELIAEGIERELVSKIQTMRKEAGFEVTDRIAVGYVCEGKAKEVLSSGAFAADVLAVSVTEGIEEGSYVKEWDINGEKATLAVIRR